MCLPPFLATSLQCGPENRGLGRRLAARADGLRLWWVEAHGQYGVCVRQLDRAVAAAAVRDYALPSDEDEEFSEDDDELEDYDSAEDFIQSAF